MAQHLPSPWPRSGPCCEQQRQQPRAMQEPEMPNSESSPVGWIKMICSSVYEGSLIENTKNGEGIRRRHRADRSAVHPAPMPMGVESMSGTKFWTQGVGQAILVNILYDTSSSRRRSLSDRCSEGDIIRGFSSSETSTTAGVLSTPRV